ncbi:MAG: hypothetical protein Q9182_007167 [Xanthomendoza sp. 2 TL-2023]
MSIPTPKPINTTIHTAQFLGLTSTLVLSGINIGASILTLPILYTRPTAISTPIFNELYLRGAATLVPLGIFSAACSAFVAYNLPSSQRNLWTVAAVSTFAQTPWTLFVMMRTNNRLNAIAASKVEQEKASKDEVVGLLRRWAWLNAARGMLAMFGGLVVVWSLLERQM